MNLVIDIGNTAVKLGFFRNGELVRTTKASHEELAASMSELIQSPEISGKLKYLAYLNVGMRSLAVDWTAIASKTNIRILNISSAIPLPFASRYATMETLGADRLMGLAGAFAMTKGPLLVIDAGSAITYDVLDVENRYLGGAIGPGMNMRYRALHEFTANLLAVRPVVKAKLIGDSTQSSIESGVLNGLIEEIKGVCNRYKELFGKELRIFLTGGDCELLRNHLKSINFVDPHLILRGMNATIHYNASIQ